MAVLCVDRSEGRTRGQAVEGGSLCPGALQRVPGSGPDSAAAHIRAGNSRKSPFLSTSFLLSGPGCGPAGPGRAAAEPGRATAPP